MNKDVPPADHVNAGALRPQGRAAGRVLLVDDDPLIRTLLAACLKAAGFSICEAGNGLECLREVEAQSFDVIFMDIVMPEMNGIVATQELRKRGVKSWIVVVSSQQKVGDVTLLDAAKEFGADDAMQKPFNLATIANDVHALLAKRNA
ncbi:MAG: response regulator [Rhodospirillaceae bacterium]|nr:response regulator [Rhodospirillaceae bacterium]